MKKRFRKREKGEVATIPWHAIPVEEMYKKLCSKPDGLSDDEVVERHKEFGRNVLLVMEAFKVIQSRNLAGQPRSGAA